MAHLEEPGPEAGTETDTVDEEVVAVEVQDGAAVGEGVDMLAVAGVAQPRDRTDGEAGVRRARGRGVGGAEVATPDKGSSGRQRPPRPKRCNGKDS